MIGVVGSSNHPHYSNKEEWATGLCRARQKYDEGMDRDDTQHAGGGGENYSKTGTF